MVQVLCTLYLYSIDSFGMPCFFKRGAVKQFNIIHVWKIQEDGGIIHAHIIHNLQGKTQADL
jgi:hypothetical protein